MPIIKVEDAESEQALQYVMDRLEHIKNTVLMADQAKKVVLESSKDDLEVPTVITGHDAQMIILGMKLIAGLIDTVEIERVSQSEPHLCSMCGHKQVPVISDIQDKSKASCFACGHSDYYNKE